MAGFPWAIAQLSPKADRSKSLRRLPREQQDNTDSFHSIKTLKSMQSSKFMIALWAWRL